MRRTVARPPAVEAGAPVRPDVHDPRRTADATDAEAVARNFLRVSPHPSEQPAAQR